MSGMLLSFFSLRTFCRAVPSHLIPLPRQEKRDLTSPKPKSKLRETALQEFDTFIYLLVVSIVLAAIETTISWNDITGVNEVSSPAQTIPLIIGVGAVARVVYISAMGVGLLSLPSLIIWSLIARRVFGRELGVWVWEIQVYFVSRSVKIVSYFVC